MSLYSLARAVSSSRVNGSCISQQLHDLHRPDDHYLSEFHQRVVGEIKQKLAASEFHPSSQACPQCHSHFVSIEVDHVPLLYCRDCHSWWFEAHELMHFTELFEDTADGDFVDRETQLPCPICSVALREQPLRVNSNLLVHTCPNGHGVYLEDGEFVRAMEVSDRVDGLAGHLNDQHLHVWRELQMRLVNGDFIPSEMTCRECNEPVVTAIVDGIAIDYCPQCQSCWFDTHELQHFTGQSRDVPGDHLSSRETPHLCPKCQHHLRLYQFHPHTNVMIEACPMAHGVYLRSGQFPRVMQASEQVITKH